jgi:hypothetical protein
MMKKGIFYLLTLLLLTTFSCSNSVEQNDTKNKRLFEVNETEGGNMQMSLDNWSMWRTTRIILTNIVY